MKVKFQVGDAVRMDSFVTVNGVSLINNKIYYTVEIDNGVMYHVPESVLHPVVTPEELGEQT